MWSISGAQASAPPVSTFTKVKLCTTTSEIIFKPGKERTVADMAIDEHFALLDEVLNPPSNKEETREEIDPYYAQSHQNDFEEQRQENHPERLTRGTRAVKQEDELKGTSTTGSKEIKHQEKPKDELSTTLKELEVMHLDTRCATAIQDILLNRLMFSGGYPEHEDGDRQKIFGYPSCCHYTVGEETLLDNSCVGDYVSQFRYDILREMSRALPRFKGIIRREVKGMAKLGKFLDKCVLYRDASFCQGSGSDHPGHFQCVSESG